MGMDSSFYRVGMKYKPNLDNYSQHRDTLFSYIDGSMWTSEFRNFRSLQSKIESMKGIDHSESTDYTENSYEFEINEDDLEELSRWLIDNEHSFYEFSDVLWLTIKEARKCLNEGFRIFYSGNW